MCCGQSGKCFDFAIRAYWSRIKQPNLIHKMHGVDQSMQVHKQTKIVCENFEIKKKTNKIE